MGKRKMSGHDIELLERLKRENKSLKKQLARLQKQLNRIDLDRFQNLEEIVEAQYKEEKELHQKTKRDQLLEKWKCFHCDDGYIHLIVVNRPDGVYYFRRCRECGHKTKLQKYNENVEGVTE